MVTPRPFSTRLERKYCPTMFHSNREFVARECTSIANRTSTTTAAIQRPGWRTGTALISSTGALPDGAGEPLVWPGVSPALGAVTAYLYGSSLPGQNYWCLTLGPVDHRVADGTALNSPLSQDLL